jgi:hypothetical protein
MSAFEGVVEEQRLGFVATVRPDGTRHDSPSHGEHYGRLSPGDFAKPFQVHAGVVPGTAVMTARRAAIRYEVFDRPRGAEVRLRSADPAAIAAIHEFLAFQRTAHHAAGHEGMTIPTRSR